MNIQLKEREITEAIKNYIALQGININGKTIVVDYTAGRKETGISAEISIDDNLLTTTLNAVKQQFPSNGETKTVAVKPKPADLVTPYEDKVAEPEDDTPFALQTGLTAGEISSELAEPAPAKASSLFSKG